MLTCTNGVSPNHVPATDLEPRDIVDTCPLTEFENGLDLLHEADDDVVVRLESSL